MSVNKGRVTVSLDINLIDRIDHDRGRISRSRFIQDMLNDSLEKITYYEEKLY